MPVTVSEQQPSESDFANFTSRNEKHRGIASKEIADLHK